MIGAENMLVSASGGIALAYDPLLRLQQTSGGSAGTTRFAYDGQDLIAEYNGSGAVLRRYVHGPGSDEPLVWYEGAGTADRRWLHADERGSVIAVSNSAGAVTAVNRYDEYGIPSSSNVGRFQYTGQNWLAELGMYHYKARIYSPTLGRFLQTDSIGYGDGMNIYAYVGNDPINFVDPTGQCTATWDDIFKGMSDGSEVYLGSENFQLKGCDSQSGGKPTLFFGGAGGGGGGQPASQPQCKGPPTPPGADKQKLAEPTRANARAARDAARNVGPISAPLWFHSAVRSGGDWDYKRSSSKPRGGPQFEAFGNYHYGYTGTAMGFPEGMLLREAGRAQIAAGTSRPEYGTPGGLFGVGAKAPYGDDPIDQQHIKDGIQDSKNDC